MTSTGTPLRWEVHGLKMAGLGWGDPESSPVLCLHGWLDNAASFAVLAPLFKNHYLVAPDLTGHGQSDRRSADATYQIWDDLPEVLGIVQALRWERFALMGHSRGAVIGSLFAASFPERVERLVLLDAVGPQPVADNLFPIQMRKFLEEKARLLRKENRFFANLGEAVSAQQAGGMAPEPARLIAERNLRACAQGFTWTTDPRLRGPSAVKLTPGQVDATLGALVMPTLLLLAEQGHGGRYEAMYRLARRAIPELRTEYIPGSHHFHMEQPAVQAVATKISEFLLDE